MAVAVMVNSCFTSLSLSLVMEEEAIEAVDRSVWCDIIVSIKRILVLKLNLKLLFLLACGRECECECECECIISSLTMFWKW